MEQTETLLSTKEIAEILNVDVSTVKKTVKRLEDDGEVLHHSTNVKGNIVFYYDEHQATLIKQEIQKHHNLASRQIDDVTTQLEENQTIFNAMQILQRRNNELTVRAEQAEKTNALLMHTSQTYTFTEIAKELNKPVKGFGEWLHQEGYIYSQNGTWIPYFGKEELFESKQVAINESFSKYNTHVTQKGRLELLKKYGGKSIG